MAVDDNGYLYIRGIGFQDADILLILDTDGNFASRIPSGEYTASQLGGIGIGKDGSAYTSLENMPAYETPCSVEGALRCALPDGRIVLVSCTEYASRQRENGDTEYEWIPEKTCFYYIPSLRKN